ncbi:diguanylate cyclase [Rubellimicrobium rubrum]|uniref:Diguanylate cyclase n=1 Tax=Rubellimicrobium rubrum TaxID=2585369 RepID=A0A5C4N8M5_9RHOB|nr:diguanylate cyclase [Rubellimicrobium rubrum]TNC53010.1 diguanylate cyclase [Rubellimicrobium rubrum]
MMWRTDMKWAGVMVLLTALVIGALVLSYREQAEGDLRVQARDASEQRISSLKTLLSIMQDIESGQRGFVITGLDEYLEPYDAALLRLAGAIGSLRQGYAGQPHLRLEMAAIYRLADQKKERAASVIAVRRTQGFEAAREMMLDRVGKRIMDALRSEIAFMTSIEHTHVLKSEQDYAATLIQSRRAFLFLSAVTFVSMGILLWLAAREMRASQQANARLSYLADHDPLTGLANRRFLHGTLEQALSAGPLPGQRHGLFILDLDGFKAVNDQLGHEAGDRLLVEVADRLKAVTRASDVLARLGGDEFALFMPDLSFQSEDQEITARLRCAIALIDPPHHAARISASIGLAVFPDEVRSSSELLRLADERMYQDKRGAKNPLGQTGPQRAVS